MKTALLLAAAWAISLRAHAHGFEERYDLPVPLAYVVAGACAMVLLTFVFAIFFVRQPSKSSSRPSQSSPALSQTRIPPGLIGLARGLAWLLFALTLAAALWGSGDPLMNLAPTLVWIVWWIGLSFAVILLGNVWPALDPWRTSFDLLDACARKMGRSQGISLGWTWPARLGVWPAVFLLLAWCWLEVIYPIAASPFKLGCAALVWTVLNLAGMVALGRDSWQRHADVFSVYFSTLGQMAPISFNARLKAFSWRPLGHGLTQDKTFHGPGHVGFIMAMLSTVLFDGMHGGAAWLVFEQGLKKIAPQWMDVNGYFAGTVGLLVVWLLFVLAYIVTCRLCAILMGPSAAGNADYRMARRFAPTLIPIAAAYNIAHNFSNLLIQGQTVFQLLSDPFGWQWDLFGTARYYPDISVVDATVTWYVALASIVLGHVMSIWLAHRVALNLGLSARRTALGTLPLTLLMVAYTAISLTVIAEPMVSYSP